VPPLADSQPELATALVDRFVTRFQAAWPEGGLSDEEVRSGLVIDVGELQGEPCLTVTYRGTTSISWDGSQADAEQIVDEIADNHAFDSEGDRWIYGDGWREYRP
jgi:hypothetical protein